MAGHLYLGQGGQLGYPDIVARNMFQGTLQFITTGSGVTEATLQTGGAFLKGVGVDGFNEGAVVFLIDGVSLGTIGSGAIDNWRTAWYQGAVISVRTATAQAFSFLTGSDGGSPFVWG